MKRLAGVFGCAPASTRLRSGPANREAGHNHYRAFRDNETYNLAHATPKLAMPVLAMGQAPPRAGWLRSLPALALPAPRPHGPCIVV